VAPGSVDPSAGQRVAFNEHPVDQPPELSAVLNQPDT